MQGGEPQLYRLCAEVDCLALRGACCFADGTCQDLRHVTCLSAGGMGFFPDQTCATHTCSQSQACCFADGSCEDLTPGVCLRSRGEPGPYGSACSDDCNGDLLVDACQLLGDVDSNGTVSLNDWSQVVGCLSGPGIPVSGQSCRVCILDCDDDVDLRDIAVFQRAFGGE